MSISLRQRAYFTGFPKKILQRKNRRRVTDTPPASLKIFLSCAGQNHVGKGVYTQLPVVLVKIV